MDVLQYAVPEERGDHSRVYYAVDPDQMYPAMIDYIQDVVEGEVDALEGVNAHGARDVRFYLGQARRFDPKAWTLARRPVHQVKRGERELRGQALEIARLWYTALLRSLSRKPLGLHILKGSGAYRL